MLTKNLNDAVEANVGLTNEQHALVIQLVVASVNRAKEEIADKIIDSMHWSDGDLWLEQLDHEITEIWRELNA